MANIITGGLSMALMSADSSAKAAIKPMNMVSRELHKRDPDLELIERAGMYGGMKLDQAGQSLDKAQEELREAQKAASQEEKAEMENRLEEKAAEKTAERKAEKAAEREQAAGEMAGEMTTAERVRFADNHSKKQETGRSVGFVPDRCDQDIEEIHIQAVWERTSMELSLSGDFGAGVSAGQKYSSDAFRDKVSRMRLDLRG